VPRARPLVAYEVEAESNGGGPRCVGRCDERVFPEGAQPRGLPCGEGGFPPRAMAERSREGRQPTDEQGEGSGAKSRASDKGYPAEAADS